MGKVRLASIAVFIVAGINALGMGVLLPSCEKHSTPAAVVLPWESLSAVEQNDSEILRIAGEARDSLSVFFRHLNRAGAGE